MSSFGLNTISISNLKTAKSYLNILQRLESSDKKAAAFLRAELKRMPGVRQDVGVAPDERSAVSDAAMEFEDGCGGSFRAATVRRTARRLPYLSVTVPALVGAASDAGLTQVGTRWEARAGMAGQNCAPTPGYSKKNEECYSTIT